MQFVESSSNAVTDITIPEGNVVKIEEQMTGKILWERKSKKFPDDLSDVSLEWFSIGLDEIAPDYSADDRNIVAIASPTSKYINSDYKNNSSIITIRACVNGTSNSAIRDTIYEAPCFYRKSKNEWARILNPASLIRFGSELSENTSILAISEDGNVILVRSNDKTYYIENDEELSPYWLCSNIQYGDELIIGSTTGKNYGLQNLHIFTQNYHYEFENENSTIKIRIDDGYSQMSTPNKYVRIVHAPELKKYLLTDLRYEYKYYEPQLGTATLDTYDLTTNKNFSFPETFSSFDIEEQDGKLILPANAVQTYRNTGLGVHTVNPCWSSKYQLFFAGYISYAQTQINDSYWNTSITYENYLLTSNDGISWSRKKLFSDGSPVFGVIELTTSDRLCAVGKGKVALSEDGITWIEKSLPFTSSGSYSPRYSYSPAYDLFCILYQNKAYVTRNFETWKQSEKAPFYFSTIGEKLIHCGDGIFATITTSNKILGILTTVHPIRGTITL